MVKLFYEDSMHNYLENLKQEVSSFIDNISKKDILNTNEDEYYEYLISKFKIENILIDEKEVYTDEPEEIKIDVSQDPNRDIINRSKPFPVKGSLIKVHIPYKGLKELFKVRPSSFVMHTFRADIDTNEVVISYEYPSDKLNKESLESQIQGDLDFIRKMVDNQESEINHFNEEELPNLVKSLFAKRKNTLSSDENVVSSLSIPMKRKNTSQLVFLPPKIKRIMELEKPKVKSGSPNPELDFKEYEYIIEIINSMGRALEQCSKTIRDLGEEDLRLLFLIILNTHYENQAGGETFNKEGKTDILIKSKGRNIFIAECKLWEGSQYFIKGIDQLLNYLSWRDTKTSYIIFNKKKNFSDIIKKAEGIIKKHTNFMRQIEVLDEGCIMYQFRHADDEKKEIFLTLHLFNIPV